MSIIIFFGFALCVFTAGVIAIVLTFHHWYKAHLDGKNKENSKIVTETNP